MVERIEDRRRAIGGEWGTGSTVSTGGGFWRRNRWTLVSLPIAAAILVFAWIALEPVYGYQGPRIAFYGSVIDQSGRAVGGADVTIEVFQKPMRVGFWDDGYR